jgi:hypothetical protein
MTNVHTPDIVGQRFGRWKVLSVYRKTKGGWYARSACDCSPDIVRDVYRGNLLSGQSQSCGCLKRDRTRVLRGLAPLLPL